MNKKLVLCATLAFICVTGSTVNLQLKYNKWQQINKQENLRQDAVISTRFNYEESDNNLFYNANELAQIIVEESEVKDSIVENEDNTLELIKELCPYVKVKDGTIILPASTSTPTEKIVYSRYDELVGQLLSEAEDCIGTPYVWGGTTKGKGMDCSGFTQYIYKQIGFTLPRVSYMQCKVGKLVKRNELKPGDLLFFDTTNSRDKNDIKTPDSEYEYALQMASNYVPNVISHVGLYVGDGMMIHAASGEGRIMYQSLDKDYYKVRFINARRLIKDE